MLLDVQVIMYSLQILGLRKEMYSGGVDAEVGTWESSLVYRPPEKSSVAEETLRGQEMLRDIYRAFVEIKSEVTTAKVLTPA